jgi:alanyl-tRNA synthetase
MISLHVISLIGLSSILFAVAIFFWWRSRSARVDPETIRKWQKPHQPSTIKPGNQNDPKLVEAADLLNAPPEDVPDRVRVLDEKVRTLEGEVASLRRRWAKTWMDLNRRTPDENESIVIVAQLENGCLDDAEALAKVAAGRENHIVIAAAHLDGAFAVGVGEEFSSMVEANDISGRIGRQVGGNGGGDKVIATGGGGEPRELRSAIEKVKTEVESTVAGSTNENPETSSQ